MNENEERKSQAASRPAVRDPQHLPVAFRAFHIQYRRAYQHYAELQLGDRCMADDVVHAVFLDLLKGWSRLMEEANPTASAWAYLKETVDGVLIAQGREAAMAQTAMFYRVARAVLEDARQEFAAMESSVGLYPAIARLPGRQFDAVVLHYVLAYTTARTASIMGVNEDTVRSHCYHARNRISREMGLELSSPDRNEE